jgi:hypothetical protein
MAESGVENYVNGLIPTVNEAVAILVAEHNAIAANKEHSKADRVDGLRALFMKHSASNSWFDKDFEYKDASNESDCWTEATKLKNLGAVAKEEVITTTQVGHQTSQEHMLRYATAPVKIWDIYGKVVELYDQNGLLIDDDGKAKGKGKKGKGKDKEDKKPVFNLDLIEKAYQTALSVEETYQLLEKLTIREVSLKKFKFYVNSYVSQKKIEGTLKEHLAFEMVEDKYEPVGKDKSWEIISARFESHLGRPKIEKLADTLAKPDGMIAPKTITDERKAKGDRPAANELMKQWETLNSELKEVICHVRNNWNKKEGEEDAVEPVWVEWVTLPKGDRVKGEFWNLNMAGDQVAGESAKGKLKAMITHLDDYNEKGDVSLDDLKTKFKMMVTNVKKLGLPNGYAFVVLTVWHYVGA